MELILAGIGLIAIITVLTYIVWWGYRKSLARVSTKIMFELNSMDTEKVTIKDLQDLAIYMKAVKKMREINEENERYDNFGGMYS